MGVIDRREFAAMVPALLALSGLGGKEVEGQAMTAPLKTLSSGTFKPGPPTGHDKDKVGHSYLLGMLAAGNVRLEMHETTQQEGAVHEAVGTHKHNEIWLVREGHAELNINGVSQYMEAGDVGLVTAGDKHWIANKGPGPVTYFVVTVGPPE